MYLTFPCISDVYTLVGASKRGQVENAFAHTGVFTGSCIISIFFAVTLVFVLFSTYFFKTFVNGINSEQIKELEKVLEKVEANSDISLELSMKVIDKDVTIGEIKGFTTRSCETLKKKIRRDTV